MEWLKNAVREQIEDELADILGDHGINPHEYVGFGGPTLVESGTDRLVKRLFGD